MVRDAQQQALEQLRGMRQQSNDPRSQSLMDAVEKEMNKASGQLGQAADKNSVAPLPAALTAEQSAYQAALKLMAREYQVARARGTRASGASNARRTAPNGRFDDLDLQQNADRYETERQGFVATKYTPQQREQLQVASRLKDLAKRQEDLNARLREVQAALQEARTPQERADLQEQLKRLTEEQRDMLADVDELRQRMDNAENQSQMSQQRQQLDQTRSQVQQAAESLGQNSVPQALASGTRAQNELQQLQNDVRKMNSGQFSDAMRQIRENAKSAFPKMSRIWRRKSMTWRTTKNWAKPTSNASSAWILPRNSCNKKTASAIWLTRCGRFRSSPKPPSRCCPDSFTTRCGRPASINWTIRSPPPRNMSGAVFSGRRSPEQPARHEH